MIDPPKLSDEAGPYASAVNTIKPADTASIILPDRPVISGECHSNAGWQKKMNVDQECVNT
jgi:hypothetical protein